MGPERQDLLFRPWLTINMKPSSMSRAPVQTGVHFTLYVLPALMLFTDLPAGSDRQNRYTTGPASAPSPSFFLSTFL